ncbi:DUF4105 domain-containing protein [Roseimicrobium sp. ORNL1]|uniref:Lnb N-terminal periplasmic domain-containing protein n=1 Tax=Roseimicrobium sp. ORNL1 TaxID=2711231 RepID=UPI0013E11D1D|nr:DUF4105 domain-containing protein [Roseimicrobium sp. ORNL1]QIF01498.1 DUF4105 domain-containing protein [Roseimicrobium sp. ORNL1]
MSTVQETPPAATPATKSRSTSWLSKPFRWAYTTVAFFIGLLYILWPTLALYYTTVPWNWARASLALAYLAFGIWALWIRRTFKSRAVLAVLFLGVLAWFISIRPSNDRIWRTDVAVVPRVIVNGDSVRFTGFRNFDYKSLEDFTVKYEEREVFLSHLTSVDLFISYWVEGPVGHTFLTFNFDNSPPVCISIETRPEEHESYDPIASMFKKYELIYVVGDERDLVRVRSNFRKEDVFLYKIRIPAAGARALFKVYIDRINELANKPEFYHLLSNSCTINIVRYANAAGREGGFHIGHLLNGLFDRYLFEAGFIDTNLPFPRLRARAHINARAQEANSAPDFSTRIRTLPPPEKE